MDGAAYHIRFAGCLAFHEKPFLSLLHATGEKELWGSSFSHSHISEVELQASSIKWAAKSIVSFMEKDPKLSLCFFFFEEFLRITSLEGNIYQLTTQS